MNRLGEEFYHNKEYIMLSPRVKQLIFKLLVSIFIPDHRIVYRQYSETRSARHKMNHFLRIVTPADLQEAKLQHIAERMNDLQKLIYSLCEKGFSDEEIAHKLNMPLHKIQKHLDNIEEELLHLFRYME